MQIQNIRKYYAITLVVLLTLTIGSPLFVVPVKADLYIDTDSANVHESEGPSKVTLYGTLKKMGTEEAWDVYFKIDGVGWVDSGVLTSPGTFQATTTQTLDPGTYSYYAQCDNDIDDNGNEDSTKYHRGSTKQFTIQPEDPIPPKINSHIQHSCGKTTAQIIVDVTDCGSPAQCICTIKVTGPGGYTRTKQESISQPRSITKNFIGLSPGITYNVEAYADNGQRSNTASKSITTQSTVKVSKPSIVEKSDDSVKLRATLTEGGEGCSCELYIKKNGAIVDQSDVMIRNEGQTFEWYCDGLDPDTTYYAHAYAEKGSVHDDTMKSFKTDPASSIGIDLKEPEINGRDVTLTGEVTEGSDLTCTFYIFKGGTQKRSHEMDGTYSKGDTFSWPFSNLDEGDDYTARLKAKSNSGAEDSDEDDFEIESGQSEEVNVEIRGLDTGSNWVTIEGYINEGDGLTCTFYIFKGEEQITSEEIEDEKSAGQSFTWSYRELSSSTDYVARLSAEDTEGNSDSFDDEFTTTSGEDPDVMVTAEDISDEEVIITGEITKDNGCKFSCELSIKDKLGRVVKGPIDKGMHNENDPFSHNFDGLEAYTEYKASLEIKNESEYPNGIFRENKFTTAPGDLSVTLEEPEVDDNQVTLRGKIEEDGNAKCYCRLYIDDGEVWFKSFLTKKYEKNDGFEHTFTGLPEGDYTAWAEIWVTDVHHHKTKDDKEFNIDSNSIILTYNEIVNEKSDFTVESNVYVDFEYDGNAKNNTKSATFKAPFYEDKEVIEVVATRDGETEIATINIQDYLELDISNQESILEGRKLDITVKDNDGNSIFEANVTVQSANGSMSASTRKNGIVTFKGDDYQSLSLDGDTDCTIIAEKHGYSSSESSIAIKHAYLQFDSPSEGATFTGGENIQDVIIVLDQDRNPVSNAKVELEGSSSPKRYTNNEGKPKNPVMVPNVNGIKVLTVTKEGYKSASININIGEGFHDTATINIQIWKGDSPPAPLADAAVTLKGKIIKVIGPDVIDVIKTDSTNESGWAHILFNIEKDGNNNPIYDEYCVFASKSGYIEKEWDEGWREINPDDEINANNLFLFSGDGGFGMKNDPECRFSYTPLSPKVKEPVTFEYESGNVGSIYWIFDDGTIISDEKKLEHTYSSSGEHKVILIVEYSDGKKESYSKTLEVAPQYCGILSRIKTTLRNIFNNLKSRLNLDSETMPNYLLRLTETNLFNKIF